MRSLVLLTRQQIAETLQGLEETWRIRTETSAGNLRGRGDAEGPAGAWLDFYGIVRDWEDPSHTHGPAPAQPGQAFPILALDYEAHEEMATHQIEKILAKLEERYPLLAMLVIHRLGRIPVGEASLLVRVLSPHREEALQACAEFIDELKTWVPIWKHPIRA